MAAHQKHRAAIKMVCSCRCGPDVRWYRSWIWAIWKDPAPEDLLEGMVAPWVRICVDRLLDTRAHGRVVSNLLEMAEVLSPQGTVRWEMQGSRHFWRPHWSAPWKTVRGQGSFSGHHCQGQPYQSSKIVSAMSLSSLPHLEPWKTRDRPVKSKAQEQSPEVDQAPLP